MGKIFVLNAWQNARPVPVDINYDKAIWSGLSWAVGEIKTFSNGSRTAADSTLLFR
jgi:hypothetical protein